MSCTHHRNSKTPRLRSGFCQNEDTGTWCAYPVIDCRPSGGPSQTDELAYQYTQKFLADLIKRRAVWGKSEEVRL